MEISSLMFALGLLSAGIWLIFTINGEFKGKQRQEQRFSSPVPNRNQTLPRQTTPARRTVLPPTPAPPARAAKIATVADERKGAADKWQSLDAAVVYEKFEKFTRE